MRSIPARKRFLITLAISLVSFLISSKNVLGQNFLKNPGFEEGIESWESSGGGATASIVSNPVHGGTAAVEVKNSSTSSYGIQQKVEGISEAKTYRLSGYVKITDPNVEKAFLRVGWYDENGNQKSTSDSNQITGVSDWSGLVVEKTIPPGVVSAKVRAVLSSKTGGVLASAYFDDLSFEEVIPPTLTPTPAPTPTPTPTSTPTPKDYSNIFISEFMAYPESGDEWVELYNNNDFEVDLYGWYIDDIAEGGSPPRQISGIISPKSQKQFSLNSNAYLNNGGDDVRLLNANQVEKDKVSFETTSKGKSWSKDKNGKWCQLDPSPNTPNPECPKEEDSPTSISTSTPTQKPPSPTPTPKPTPTLKIVPTEANKSGEVLGEEEEATVGEFYPLEATEEAKEVKEATSAGNKNSKNKILGGIFIGAGLVAIFGAAFSLWYTKLK